MGFQQEYMKPMKDKNRGPKEPTFLPPFLHLLHAFMFSCWNPAAVFNGEDMAKKTAPRVGIIMGSVSDWKTMSAAAAMLDTFDVAYEKNVVSAHRTPHWLAEYAGRAQQRGLQVIIAGAGGAAHLPGMAAAFTTLPVLGVPVESRALKGLDSLLSIAQMPAGVPVGALAIGEPGAKNAALLAVSILALHDGDLRAKWEKFRATQTAQVRAQKLPRS
jgi:5-(carboxyamino)imidazole ribonucleotide mutase